MTITLYGIPNCDTVKKARGWLSARGIDPIFHDYKKAGVDPVALDRWIDTVGWEPLLNKAGTTFRQLPEVDKQDIDMAKARRLMLDNPSLIKRPVVEGAARLLVGFKPADYEEAGL